MRPVIAVLPGDGIGSEVVEAALPVVSALGLGWELRFGEIGWACWRRGGDPVPEATWRLIEESDGGLVGAVTSKPEREAQAELAPELRARPVRLRHRAGEHRRPLRGFRRRGGRGLSRPLVREHPNAARSGPDGVRIGLRLQTDFGTDRILRFAFELARREGRRRVVVADKPNILRASGERLRERLARIAPEYPEVEADVQNADAVAMRLVADPGGFEVIVAENLLGDILSDVAAGVVGSLGLAASGNIGRGWSYFEPVHGSAPDIAGQGVANPLGMILSVAGLAERLGSRAEADALRRAVRAVVARGERTTPDLGGASTTAQTAAAVIAELR